MGNRCAMLRKRFWDSPFGEWVDFKWTNFYCRHAYYHLMRSRTDPETFIVIYDRDCDDAPVVPGFSIVVARWTPRGCKRAAQSAIWYDALVDAVGRENMLRIMCNAQAERKDSHAKP